MTSTIHVRPANAADVGAIVAIHLQAFEGFFLSTLGARFLRRLYGVAVSHAEVVSQVAADPSGVCGFAVGPLNPASYFRTLLVDQGLGFVLDATPRLLRHPLDVGRRLLTAIVYRGEQPPLRPAAALLSSLGVLPTARGKGIGGMLIEAFCREAARRAATHVFLTTDRHRNDAANRLYLRHGFVLESSIVRSDGRVMNRYCRSLSEEAKSFSIQDPATHRE